MPESNAVEILLVEDNPRDAELTLHVLNRKDAAGSVHTVRDGEEALDFLFCRGAYSGRSFESPPRLVLLDVKLPKVNGLEVLQKVKEDPRTRAIPVVIFDLVAAYQHGANSYIQKPLEFTDFRETARHLGIYWLSVNMAPPTRAFCFD